ncbi:DNA topoisomerase IV [Flavobacteriaceae bacterium]|nr:DNA topoisomerase IV [Flavobacteriaceae bacterium]
MKKFLILPLLLISCYSVERDCNDFRTGSFEFSTSINDSVVKSTFIRTDNYEIEEFNGVKDSSTIRWVNECEFILTKINPSTNQEKRPIRIKILRTMGDSYDFEYSQVSNPSKVNRGTVNKIYIQD